MRLDVAISFMVVSTLGVSGAFHRRTAWPLLANFAILGVADYGFGITYSPEIYFWSDMATFCAILLLRRDWVDTAVLATFPLSTITYGFAPNADIAYWSLWVLGLTQYLLVAPWNSIEQLTGLVRERFAWGH